jgi:hypothetical protein
MFNVKMPVLLKNYWSIKPLAIQISVSAAIHTHFQAFAGQAWSS